jgi:subtilisin family serine protease
MKKIIIFNLALVFVASLANASRVAVVDSGTDMQHNLIKDHVLLNTSEIAGNRVDDDRNGKVDDVYGWNFAVDSNRIFAMEPLQMMNPIVYPLIRVIAHKQAGITTTAEDQFYTQNVTNLTAEQKNQLAAHINYYGEYLHSTHVTGLVLQQNPNAKVMSARVFPDDLPPEYSTTTHKLTHGPIDWVYRLLAIASNGTFKNVATYLNEQHVDVANYSLGMSLSTIAKASLALRGNQNPTDQEIAAETQRLYAQYEIEGKAWMASSPNTLFVIAAGNDGTDNDVLPAFPGNIRNDNSICVAATQAYQKLAYFSNYGATTVDVAAPGVSVLSSVPSLDQSATLPLSGTSMAAPFVTGVASRVKDANPALTPKDIKTILMGTVDKKDWLVGKVVSGGVVNANRAAEAGRLSQSMSLDQAIAQARQTVPDCLALTAGPQAIPGVTHATTLDSFAKQFVF